MTEIFSLVLALAGVTALMLGVIYILKGLLTRVTGTKGGKGMSVISCLGVGQDRQVVAVRAGNKYLLLGVSGAGINMLCELSEEDIDVIRSSDAASDPGRAFSDFLSARMRSDEQRTCKESPFLKKKGSEDDDKDSTL